MNIRLVVKILIATLVITGVVFLAVYVKSESGFGKKYRVLEIKDNNSGKVYKKWILEETGEFSIEFIHSVHQSPVRETFKIEGSMIRPIAVRFFSFGAGMQSDLEEGQTLSQEGDALVLRGFSSSFRELNLIPGTVSDHLFFFRDEVYSLRELCGRNAHIKIHVK